MSNKQLLTHQKNRAWMEVDLHQLEHNVKEIKKIISKNSQIMGIVKANAYGHGAVEITKKLQEMGIHYFAVATLQEGIILRKAGIKDPIMILGYTSIKEIPDVIKYRLEQTIVNYDYAKEIKKLSLKKPLSIHIKVNTGMNRLGEEADNIDHIIEMYQMKCFKVKGIYTHLCVADSMKEEDIIFTKMQFKKYDGVIERIKKAGFDPGIRHVQSSYGILHYQDVAYDYVRPGIILYGAYTMKEDKPLLHLKPVLSLKATITSIHHLKAGQSVGYGRNFIAEKDMKIATVSIGYADGYPRNLSHKQAIVYVRGKKAVVIGNICMDQLMIDVTHMKKIKPGDEVILIGKEKGILLEDIASLSDTISHEIVSRLGNRLERIYIS